jgi:hypothetical protein
MNALGIGGFVSRAGVGASCISSLFSEYEACEECNHKVKHTPCLFFLMFVCLFSYLLVYSQICSFDVRFVYCLLIGH